MFLPFCRSRRAASHPARPVVFTPRPRSKSFPSCRACKHLNNYSLEGEAALDHSKFKGGGRSNPPKPFFGYVLNHPHTHTHTFFYVSRDVIVREGAQLSVNAHEATRAPLLISPPPPQPFTGTRDRSVATAQHPTD